MPDVMRIVDWRKNFENSSSRKVDTLKWVAVPLKHGTGYRRLLAHDNGPALYGAWMALVGFAAGCPIRGTFMREDGKPYSPSDVAIVSGFPVELIKRCIEVVSNPEFEIEWIETIQSEQLPAKELQPGKNPGKSEKIPTRRDAAPDADGAPSPHYITEQDKTLQDKDKETTTTANSKVDQPAEQTPAEGQAAHWGLVGERMKKYGVARVTSTVKTATRSGFKPQQIIEWIDWLEDSAHPERKENIGAAAIVERINCADALFWAAHENWPPGDKSDTPKPADYPYAKVGDGTQLDTRDSKSLESLETMFGRVLDEMTDLDVFGLLQPIRQSYAEVNMSFRRKNPTSRLDLLRRLRARAEKSAGLVSKDRQDSS